MKNLIILFSMLVCPFWIFGQTDTDLAAQLQGMKQHYRKWLAGKPAADMLVEFDPSPVALDIQKPRFTWIMNLEGRGRKHSFNADRNTLYWSL